MMASLQLQVNQACEHILDNFDEEFGLVSSIYKPNLSQQEARPKSELFFDDCDSSLGDSSLNQVGHTSAADSLVASLSIVGCCLNKGHVLLHVATLGALGD